MIRLYPEPDAVSRARISSAGWLLSWLYPASLLPPLTTHATQYSDDAWTASLIFGVPVATASLALVWFGGRVSRGVTALSVFHVVTASLALWVLPIYLLRSTFLGAHLAAVKLQNPSFTDLATPVWHRIFAPVHVVFVTGLVVAAIYSWRSAPSETAPTM